MKQQASHLRIKPHFTIIPHSSDQVELRKGVWNPVSFTLNDDSGKGKLYSILKDLDGERSVADISKKHSVSRADIEGVLDQLQQLGAVETSSSNFLDYYIEQACPSVMQRLYQSGNTTSKKIILLGCNVITASLKSMIETYFPKHQVKYIEESNPQYQILVGSNDQWLYDALKLESEIELFSDWKDSLIIYAQQVMNPIVCNRLNIITHELKITWIHGAIDGPFLLIGPLFLATSGPCYSCFETRVSMNLREHASYVKYKQAIVDGKIYENSALSSHSPLVHLLASHLTLEIINYLATGTGFTRNKVLSIYLPTMEIAFNEVLKVSTCPVCGVIDHRDNHQLYFDYQSMFVRESV
jgi:thiazole/oxazole-forming peptide maturase SagC family component